MTHAIAIYDRRSIRKYKPEIPDGEIIAKVLDAARVAPSARNRQPWKYLVYTGEAKDRILSTMLFALSYADEEPEARPRKALEDIVEFYD